MPLSLSMEKKKNSRYYIIPASYFKKKGITPIPVTIPSKKKEDKTPAKNDTNSQGSENASNVASKFQVNEPTKISLKQSTKRTSGLSLKSLRAKKEHQIKQMNVVVDEVNLPKEPFTEEELIPVWNTFTKKILKDGKHNLASILSMGTPKLKGTTIHLEFPNATNKLEVERQQYDLLSFVRKTLKNYDITLSITVNEVLEKQYAYSPADIFEKLKEKNPDIEILKKMFGLDV